MDSKWMEEMCASLSERAVRVIRFEFAYMASRRLTDKRSPPPRAERLLDEYRAVVEESGSYQKLLIGGKSMGGRVASMIADVLHQQNAISGLVCLGYPFHPIGKPQSLRTAHLGEFSAPALICQGTRDEFGSETEVETYELSSSIELCWLEDGDHDFKPRKSMSGRTLSENLNYAADKIAAWTQTLGLK